MTSGSEYGVTLEWTDGREEHIQVSISETVLGAAEDADIGLPVGCRTGACATCVGRLLTGEVEHVRPPRALKERHHQQGYVLTCIAQPRADCRVLVGADVQTSLVENPWK